MSSLEGMPVLAESTDTGKMVKKHTKDPRCSGFQIQSKGQPPLGQCWGGGEGWREEMSELGGSLLHRERGRGKAIAPSSSHHSYFLVRVSPFLPRNTRNNHLCQWPSKRHSCSALPCPVMQNFHPLGLGWQRSKAEAQLCFKNRNRFLPGQQQNLLKQ